jgi:hypothetical protein
VHGSRNQRLLHCVLPGVEVAKAPNERAKDLRRQLAQQVLDVRFGVQLRVQRSPPAC